MKRDLLSILDLSRDEIAKLLKRGGEMKYGEPSECLVGLAVAMLFEKPSLRTRVSFDLAVNELGGHPIYLGPDEVRLGGREVVSDVAKVLAGYVDAIIARTYAHETLETLAAHSSVPIINALSDAEHPCQVLGDFLTILEHIGRLDDLRIAFIGDGNNVAASLMLGSAVMGASFVIASPHGYELPSHMIQSARSLAAGSVIIEQMVSPEEAVQSADVVYTDVWTSMGQESEIESRRRDFTGYQVNPVLMEMANPRGVFMHPLPAHHGEEISEGMLTHSRSVVFDQAENRLHVQKAVLELLLT